MKQEMQQKISDFIDGHREEMLSLWQELVNMESGSGNKAGIDAVSPGCNRFWMARAPLLGSQRWRRPEIC